jgi:hypothetical protein
VWFIAPLTAKSKTKIITAFTNAGTWNFNLFVMETWKDCHMPNRNPVWCSELQSQKQSAWVDAFWYF